jgi:16S rRNA (cytidine1402-2'-O)-methyltransferase
MSGTLFVVATPIGNLEDLTARALRILSTVSLIAAEDTRRTAHLLARHAITTPMTSFHHHNETAKAASILGRLQAGSDIALVSDAGTPTVSDPGNRLVREAIDAGIRVEPIPGASAVLAALTASGLPTQTFTFLGFPPTRSKDRKSWFAELQRAGRTVVMFESPHRLKATLEEIQSVVGDCKVSIGREITKIHEEFIRGHISTVLASLPAPVGEFTIVAEVGQEVDLAPRKVAEPREILAQFAQLVDTGGFSRRRAVQELARRLGLTPNEVYSTIEAGKKSGHDK